MRDSRGFTLIELLVVMALLGLAAAVFYGLITVTQRGFSLFTGQFDSGQRPRVALARLVTDPRQASAASAASAAQAAAEKATIPTCPAPDVTTTR